MLHICTDHYDTDEPVKSSKDKKEKKEEKQEKELDLSSQQAVAVLGRILFARFLVQRMHYFLP